MQSLLVILEGGNLKGNRNSFITPVQKENYVGKKSERRVNMATNDGSRETNKLLQSSGGALTISL